MNDKSIRIKDLQEIQASPELLKKYLDDYPDRVSEIREIVELLSTTDDIANEVVGDKPVTDETALYFAEMIVALCGDAEIVVA